MADLGPLLGGGEAGEELLPLPERGGHPVEGDRELPDLVGPVDRDDDVELAVRDLPCRLGNGFYGAGRVPRDDEDDDEADAEHAEQRVEAPPEVVLELGPDVLERILDRHLPEVTPLDDERDDDLARAAPLADDPLDLDVLGDAPGSGAPPHGRRRLGRRAVGKELAPLLDPNLADPLLLQPFAELLERFRIAGAPRSDPRRRRLDRGGERLVGGVRLREHLVLRPQVEDRLRGGGGHEDPGEGEAEAEREARTAEGIPERRHHPAILRHVRRSAKGARRPSAARSARARLRGGLGPGASGTRRAIAPRRGGPP